ncbi:MAG TPA: hypothetical protein VFQ39_01840, partial [Longimicrobium sp.]|nr:hypothetical protein [Longimicrobium sp.]
LAGLRRRGVTPEAIRAFWESTGVTKANTRIDLARFEAAVREDLNFRAPRVMAVLNPLKVVLTNYPEGETEWLDASYWPHDVPKEGSRKVPFSRELYIDRDDFAENPPKGFFRLAPGGEVRLRYGYVIRCDEVIKDAAGEVVELRCAYDPATRGGDTPDGRTVKGTIQWVSAAHALPAEVRLYDRLFTIPDPDGGEGDFKDYLNPASLVVVKGALVEPSVGDDPPGSRYQFERIGYFCSDAVESKPGALVFNRTVTLRDTWGKARTAAAPKPEKKEGKKKETASASAEAPRPRSKAPAPDGDRSPELIARCRRYRDSLGLPQEEAELLTRELATANLFEAALGRGADPASVANWVIHELPREVGDMALENLPFSGRELGELAGLVADGTLSTGAARQVLHEMVEKGGHPRELVDALGLRQVSDPSALAPVIDEVIAANAAKADEYRAGKTGLLGFFVGQVRQKTGGRANPELVKSLLTERLG